LNHPSVEPTLAYGLFQILRTGSDEPGGHDKLIVRKRGAMLMAPGYAPRGYCRTFVDRGSGGTTTGADFRLVLLKS